MSAPYSAKNQRDAMAKIQANSISLEYDEFGNPRHPAILLIMGLGTQMTAWPEPFCEALAARGFRVIRFDNRDIGLSTKFDGAPAPGPLRFLLARMLHLPLRTPYRLEDMADDALGLLESLDIAAAHVVGASMGGMIAQLIAARAPEKVLSLISIMSTSGARGLPGARPEVAGHMFSGRPAAPDRESLIDYTIKALKLISSPAYPRSDAEWRELVTAAVERSFYPQGFRRQLAAIVASGSRVELLRTIKVPTLVIHGRDDPLIPVACGVHSAECIPGARLQIIDGMGHDLPPQLWATLVGLIATHAETPPVIRTGA